jgi:hypothetical protein
MVRRAKRRSRLCALLGRRSGLPLAGSATEPSCGSSEAAAGAAPMACKPASVMRRSTPWPSGLQAGAGSCFSSPCAREQPGPEQRLSDGDARRRRQVRRRRGEPGRVPAPQLRGRRAGCR